MTGFSRRAWEPPFLPSKRVVPIIPLAVSSSHKKTPPGDKAAGGVFGPAVKRGTIWYPVGDLIDANSIARGGLCVNVLYEQINTNFDKFHIFSRTFNTISLKKRANTA